MKDYDFITLYLPREGSLARGPGSSLISQECQEWLNENVGKGTHGNIDWLINHDNDEIQWCYSGFEYDPESNYTAICRKFMFKDTKKATLFKLTWGGC